MKYLNFNCASKYTRGATTTFVIPCYKHLTVSKQCICILSAGEPEIYIYRYQNSFILFICDNKDIFMKHVHFQKSEN